MAGPVAYFKEIHKPTGVTHCASAYFSHAEPRSLTHPDALPDIVVVRGHLLQIYKVRRNAEKVDGYWLAVLAEYSLFGTVESMAVLKCRAAGRQRDSVMLAFRDAKVCVLDWDAETQSIATTSLHSFEGEKAVLGGDTVFLHAPKLVTDPQGRCASALIQGCLGILPAMEMDVLDEMMGEQTGHQVLATTVGNSYILKLAKLGITEVRDAVFLHRYSEPVLLVLHETKPSWGGMLRNTKDTMEVTAVSLNVLHKRHTRLWSIPDVPSDAFRVIAVPGGGGLILTPSLLMYVSQGGSSCLAVSSQAYAGVVPSRIEISPLPQGADEPLKAAIHAANHARVAKHARQYVYNVHPEAAPSAASSAPRAEGLELDLADCSGAWLADTTLLLGLASGQLILVNVQSEGSSAKRLKVSKAQGAPPPSCMCKVGPELLFLGSWVANSLLIRAVPEGQTLLLGGPGGQTDAADAVHVNKRPRLDSANADLGNEDGAVINHEDEEDNEVSLMYRTDAQPALPATAGASRYSLQVVDSLVSIGIVRDLVTGDTTSSAPEECVAKTERGPPKLVAAVGADKFGAVAVLRSSLVPELVTEVPLPGVDEMWAVYFQPEGLRVEDDILHHAFLFLNEKSGTKVLRTGEELDETDPSEVDFILSSRTVLAGNVLNNSRIVQVNAHGVVLLSGSTMVQDVPLKDLIGLSSTTIVAASIADPYLLLHLSSGNALLLYVDATHGQLGLVPNSSTLSGGGERITACSLYDDTSGLLAATSSADSDTSIICVVCRSARLELLSLPSMEILLTIENISNGQMVVPAVTSAAMKHAPQLPNVVEVKLECFSHLPRGAREEHDPTFMLLLLADGTLLAYRAFQSPRGDVRFKRLSLPAHAHQPQVESKSQGRAPSRNMTRFDGLGESVERSSEQLYSGIFLSGERPLWLFACRGTLIAHAMDVEGRVSGMTPFHNVNCPLGFITACMGDNGEETVKICQLPMRTRLDTPWPLQKVALRGTPHRLAYYAEARLYVLLVSRQVPYREHQEEATDGDPHASYSYICADAAAKASGIEPGAEVRLLEAGCFQTVGRYMLDPGEEPCSVAAERLHNAATGALEPYVIVGTALNYGEDYPCSGRVLLFRVSRSHSTGTSTAEPPWEATLLHASGFSRPVQDLAVMDGRLVVACGNNMQMMELRGSSLHMISFFHAQLFITSVSTIKNFILLGDVHKGLTFVHADKKANYTALSQLSKDYNDVDVEAAEFVISGKKLFFLACDAAQNLRLYTFDGGKENQTTWQGKKLMSMGAIHVGQNICSILSHRISPSSAPEGVQLRAAVFGTSAGSVATLAPTWDGLPLQELLTLQKEMILAVQQVAGLNPASFRRRYKRGLKALGGGQTFEEPVSDDRLLDAEQLSQFQWLPLSQQHALASMCGLSRQQILKALREMLIASSTF
ncbi:g2888 [Coccomyxa elongata]